MLPFFSLAFTFVIAVYVNVVGVFEYSVKNTCVYMSQFATVDMPLSYD